MNGLTDIVKAAGEPVFLSKQLEAIASSVNCCMYENNQNHMLRPSQWIQWNVRQPSVPWWKHVRCSTGPYIYLHIPSFPHPLLLVMSSGCWRPSQLYLVKRQRTPWTSHWPLSQNKYMELKWFWYLKLSLLLNIRIMVGNLNPKRNNIISETDRYLHLVAVHCWHVPRKLVLFCLMWDCFTFLFMFDAVAKPSFFIWGIMCNHIAVVKYNIVSTVPSLLRSFIQSGVCGCQSMTTGKIITQSGLIFLRPLLKSEHTVALTGHNLVVWNSHSE